MFYWAGEQLSTKTGAMERFEGLDKLTQSETPKQPKARWCGAVQ
jgi:hypothetical protein